MKKNLKANTINLILWLLLALGVSLLIVLVPLVINVSRNYDDTLIYSIPIAIIFLIIFCVTAFKTISEEAKIKNDIIKKFSLKENKLTEVLVSDSLFFPFEVSILVDAIKLITNGNYDHFIETSINVENGTLNLPYDNITPACYTLTKIFKEFGGKFYLSVDNNYNIFLILKDNDNELLSTIKLNSERNFKGVLDGFIAITSDN